MLDLRREKACYKSALPTMQPPTSFCGRSPFHHADRSCVVGFGSIIGRNSFQRKKEDALKFLGTIMGIYEGSVQ